MDRRTFSFLSMHSKFGFAHTFSILDRGHLFNQEKVASHNTTNIGGSRTFPRFSVALIPIMIRKLESQTFQKYILWQVLLLFKYGKANRSGAIATPERVCCSQFPRRKGTPHHARGHMEKHQGQSGDRGKREILRASTFTVFSTGGKRKQKKTKTKIKKQARHGKQAQAWLL